MISFLDLKKINSKHRERAINAITDIYDSGQYINGKYLSLFENSFANYCGTKYCVGVANGLDALIITLRAWIEIGKLNEGDEIIVPANTYIASILAITESNLVPVLVEPDPKTYNISYENIKKVINKKTKGILVVHLYGRCCPMPEIMELANKNNLLVLEDGAQAHGAVLDGVKTGAWGDAGAFSFYPGKNLGAIGDAGAIVTSDEELAHFSRSIGNYGSEKKYSHKIKGINSRLDEVQAAFLSIKLESIDYDNKLRRNIATHYGKNINNTNILIPKIGKNDHVYHLFIIQTKFRDELQKHLQKNNIETLIHYPTPPHKQGAYKEFSSRSFPITETIHDQVLSLPISPVMSSKEINKVVNVCNAFKM